jgi:MtaA/CmuA family methyltransferase
MTGRERIISTLQNGKADSLPLIPISMMIAAEEIGASYIDYIKDAKTHISGQVAFAEKYDIDHVSAISCPTTEAEDLGASIVYYDDHPPAIDESKALLGDKNKLKQLKVVDPGSGARMLKRLNVIEGLKREVGHDKLVEGWVEGPTAESADLRGINTYMMDFFDDPDFVDELFTFVLENAMNFAWEQKKAGADIMGVGDAASSLVGPQIFKDYIMNQQKKYVKALHEMGLLVRLHICGNISPLFPMLKEVGADILDVDHMNSMKSARAETGYSQLLSANIDPVSVLFNGTPEVVREKLQSCYSSAGPTYFAVCAGCEVPRGTPDDNIKAMQVFARSYTG